MVPRMVRVRVLRDENELYDEKLDTHLEGDVRTRSRRCHVTLFPPCNFLFSTRAELEDRIPAEGCCAPRDSRPKEI